MEIKKEDVYDILVSLGFRPEEAEDIGFSFQYEGIWMLFPVNEDEDTDSVSLLVPGLLDVTDENRQDVLEVIAEVCHRMKYVQPNIMFDKEVWLNYVHYLGENGLTAELVEHMVRVLDVAWGNFKQLMDERSEQDDD